MTPTSLGHDLTRRDPAGGNYRPPTERDRAHAARIANVTPEQMQAVVANWKAGWKSNQRRDVA